MNSFLKELEVELRPTINKVLSNPFFERLNKASLSHSELREFGLQYNIYCGYFPRYLATVAANVPDDATRLSLVKNLWEEHGEGNLEFSHRTIFCRFLDALGISKDERQKVKPLPSTQEYVDATFELCRNSHFLEGLGILSVGGEFYTGEEFSIILSGLKKYSFLSAHDLEFWSIHIDVDDVHYSEMTESLVPWIQSESDKELIRRGAHRAVELEIPFWEGLHNALSN